MRTPSTFSFRPTVEPLADRTMPSVTLIHGHIVTPTPTSDTAVCAPTRTADETVSVKLTTPVLGRKAGGDQFPSVDLATTPVFGRKAGGGQPG